MKCTMCGSIVHKENSYAIFDANKLGVEPKPKTVCGQCFVLVKILDTLVEIKDGRSKRFEIQEHNGDDA